MSPFEPQQYFPRDSRHAFGHRFYVEKPNRDYWWFIGSIAALIAIAAVVV